MRTGTAVVDIKRSIIMQTRTNYAAPDVHKDPRLGVMLACMHSRGGACVNSNEKAKNRHKIAVG